MVGGSPPKPRAIYSTPPCPSLAASTAAYRRRSFSDSHPKNRCIFCSISAEYPSMPHSWIQNLLRGQDTTAQTIREVILDHILKEFRNQVEEVIKEFIPTVRENSWKIYDQKRADAFEQLRQKIESGTLDQLVRIGLEYLEPPKL